MSIRLQVVMEEDEMREIREVARRNRMTVAEWVRQALRAARRREPTFPTEQKLAVVREAATHKYPTSDIEQMNDEIARGYAEPSE